MIKIPAINLKELRMRLHLSQSEFADRYGFSIDSVQNWEQGVRQPERSAAMLLYIISKAPGFVAKEIAKLK